MQFIETTADLNNLYNSLLSQEFICIDLEFLREHSYFAKLCLIQIASPDISAIIDPLSPELNLQSFFDLMQNSAITKVFHSGRQDLEIIYHLSGKIPFPLFDTQIAAQAAGFGEAISYENLVNHILHISLDKSSRLSDWSKRPLSQSQQKYALSDVTHMVAIYQYLKSWLTDHNRLSWIQEELDALQSPSLYVTLPQDAWKRIRHRSHNAFFLTVLRELAAWREQRSIDKDTPRQSLLKDDVLLNICAAMPCSKQELASVRGMRSDLALGKLGDEIIAVLDAAKKIDKASYVVPPRPQEIPNTDTSLLELLKLLQKIVAREQKIIPHMLADDDELKYFCHNHDYDASFLHGWRYEIFGYLAQKICRGQTAIAYNPDTKLFDFITISK